MKSYHQIQDRLNELQSDRRVFNEDGTPIYAGPIRKNAPLARIQTSIKSQIAILLWVLKDD